MCQTSILVVRGRNGEIHAFHNICSHRGNKVAYGAHGNTKTFRCSYHLWEYDLTGKLINVPDEETFPAGAPCEKLSIRKLPCAAKRNSGRDSVSSGSRP